MESGKKGSRPSLTVGGHTKTDCGIATTLVEGFVYAPDFSLADGVVGGAACAAQDKPNRATETITVLGKYEATNHFINNQDAPDLINATISSLNVSFSRSPWVKPDAG